MDTVYSINVGPMYKSDFDVTAAKRYMVLDIAPLTGAHCTVALYNLGSGT